MNLEKQYNNLYQESISKIRNDQYQTDELIDSTDDNRFGITLLIRPDKKVKSEIQKFLNQVRLIEPEQYYYPSSDIHITVMSIISCYDGFELPQISINDYVKVIQESINEFSAFDIEFRGLTASPSCIMVKGFFKEDTLNQIRENLRVNFGKSDLQQSIDKRYSIKTAHSTVIRLRKELTNKEDFLRTIEDNKDRYFGTFKVDNLELVYNDWYQRNKFVEQLHNFKI